MMSDTDKKELEEHLSKQYLLIPKNRLYHVAGGIIVGIVAFIGVTYKTVQQVLESEVAGIAKQKILMIEKEVTAAQLRIEGLERDAKTAVSTANERIAKVEQASKEAVEKLTATPIESLQAKEVKIVDKDGKTKLLIATTTTGSGLLWLYDSNDKKRMQLAENNEGAASLVLLDRDGTSRMKMMTDAAGLPSLHLYDSTKKNRLELFEDESGYAGLALLDRDGQGRMALITDKDGLPDLRLGDSEGNKRLSLYENPSGYVGLALLDRNNNSRMILTTDAAGLPSLELHDSTKKKRLHLYEDKGGYAGLALLDRNNKSRMKLMTEPNTGLSALEMYDGKGNMISSHTASPGSSAQ